jgi:phosphorylcholine metabolism protein LicD
LTFWLKRRYPPINKQKNNTDIPLKIFPIIRRDNPERRLNPQKIICKILLQFCPFHSPLATKNSKIARAKRKRNTKNMTKKNHPEVFC